MTLTEFLLARIADDETEARRFGYASPLGSIGSVSTADENSYGDMYLAIDPARLLAECAAKRAIVARHAPVEFIDAPGEYACAVTPNAGFWPCPDLRDLATVYADHPDYHEGMDA